MTRSTDSTVTMTLEDGEGVFAKVILSKEELEKIAAFIRPHRCSNPECNFPEGSGAQ